jgi:hypothetical protein
MIADIPDDAAVTASLGFVPHLAARQNLVSLHHVLKGLKTLSATAYIPPPPADVVVIDYADTLTFSAEAGYYHPWSRIDANNWIPSSDRLLHDYLAQARWRATSKNSLTVFRRGEPLTGTPSKEKPIKIVDSTMLTGQRIATPVPGAVQFRMSWEISGERRKFPWLMIVATDGVQLYPFIKGPCAVEAKDGPYYEDWTLVFPSWMKHAHYHFYAEFYNASEAAWASRSFGSQGSATNKLPPKDLTYSLTRIDLGAAIIKPGDFGPAKAP